jgi:regulator of protease activity HflC (stomatin/prohibitin superfamily)
MNIFQQKLERVKNQGRPILKRDYSYNAFSFLILGGFLALGTLGQFLWGAEFDLENIVQYSAGILFGGIVLILFPLWVMNILIIIASWMYLPLELSTAYYPLALFSSVGILLSASIELIYQWDKVVVLRMGRFRSVHGPGIFILLPLIDRVAARVDTRIRVTDFSAERAITKDTVPVHVDALCFWMVWDAKQAILEVENFEEAISLSSQTALRDAIGRNDLSTLLSGREQLGHEIQQVLDAKTNPWGVSIMSIEFTDVIIPRELEDAMSKKAQAEREKQSRIILSEAEKEVAKQFRQASEIYGDNQDALQLRAMNMVYEGIRHKSSLMVLPSSALDSMNLGTTMGMASMHQKNVKESEGTQE